MRVEQQLQKLHPNVIRYWQIIQGIRTCKWLIGGIALLVVKWIWLPSWDWLMIISILGMAFFIIKSLFFVFYGVYIKYSRRGYFLGTDELMIRWGNVWSDNSTIIPLNRVQHVDQEQDIIAQRFGLSSLTITTAGDDHSIIGLTEEDAISLRRQIIEIAKLGDSDAY